MIRKRRLVWHRNKDLRFHDHPFYSQDESATTNGNENEPTATTSVFVFDDSFGCGIQPSTCLPNEWKAVHLGPHGMRVLLESVRDLRTSSRQRNDLAQELVVRRGQTVEVLLRLVEELITMDNVGSEDDTSIENENRIEDDIEYLYEVCWNEEPGWHEHELSKKVKAALTERFDQLCKNNNITTTNRKRRKIRLAMNTAMSCTLYHPDDLPVPGEWKPLSKKEKRRLQKQHQKNKQQQANRKVPNNGPTVKSYNSNSKTNNSCIVTNDNNSDAPRRNFFVDVSPSRWTGMPRIMGDFRKIARETAGIRQCVHGVATSSTKVENIPPTPKRIQLASKHTRNRIDPGSIPTLEDLLEPLLMYLDDEKDNEDKNKFPKKKQPILGLPPSVARDACNHSLRIHHRNLRLLEKRCGGDSEEHEYESAILGGETAGLEHLDNFVRNHAHNAQRSLACVDDHQSSKLSHFLAFGCLSPRKVVAAAEEAIEERKKQKNDKSADNSENENNPKENDGTWLISHMTMRDFFLYTCLASGNRFYRLKGIPVSQKVASAIMWRDFGSDENETNNARKLWTSWATGATGLPLVDAAMTELLETGYCSNRVRQNAASVLTKDLNLDWRAGAEWFQFLLVDHCVGANWGNWLYFSGVGPDPKNRHFCTISQASKYDPCGKYVKKWLPSLRVAPSERTTNITNTSQQHREIEKDEHHLRPWDFDLSWKRPIVEPESQYVWRDLQKLQETGRLLEECTTTTGRQEKP
jgi:deoxyribodipyrimidine photo-lyase